MNDLMVKRGKLKSLEENEEMFQNLEDKRGLNTKKGVDIKK